MNDFIKGIAVNINKNMDEAVDIYGKSPKDYRTLGEVEEKKKSKKIEEDIER